MKLVEIQSKDIPQSVLDEIGDLLNNYLVAFYVLLSEQPHPRLRLIGSGTFVKIEDTHYILTAAHVWRETRDSENIGLVLTDHQTAFTIPRETIVAKELWDGRISEWGPDMALLRLPQPFVSTIEAKKSFLNLPQHKKAFASHPPATDSGLWVVMGMVGELSEIQEYPQKRIVEGHVQGGAYVSFVQQTYQRAGYDYYDLGANLQLPGVPSSFRGVSGGGLWEIGLAMKKDGTIVWEGKRYFRGVAFWQSENSDGHRMVRCHGPKSIFEKAWEAWSLPQ